MTKDKRPKKPSTKKAPAAAAPAAETTQADYGVDRRTFIIAWESGNTTEEVVAALAEHSRKLGLPPMPKPVVLARASAYRTSGVKLKKFKPGRRTAEVDEANKLIAAIRAGKQAEPTPAGPPLAAPPAGDDDKVAAAIQQLVAALKSK